MSIGRTRTSVSDPEEHNQSERPKEHTIYAADRQV